MKIGQFTWGFLGGFPGAEYDVMAQLISQEESFLLKNVANSIVKYAVNSK